MSPNVRTMDVEMISRAKDKHRVSIHSRTLKPPALQDVVAVRTAGKISYRKIWM